MALQPRDLERKFDWAAAERYIDSVLTAAARVAETDGKEITCCLYINDLKKFNFLWANNHRELMQKYHGWKIEFIRAEDYHDGDYIKFTPKKEMGSISYDYQNLPQPAEQYGALKYGR